MKLAAAKAAVQFRIRHEYEQNKKTRASAFDWWDFIFNSKVNKASIIDYFAYFQLLKIDTKNTEINEKMIVSAFRQLSLVYHPDKGGNAEKFIELTEAKNKCLEFVKLR